MHWGIEMSLEATEKECAAVAVAPRVALADIEAAIKAKYCYTAGELLQEVSTEAALDVLTICILVLKNGFTIIGKSAPASADNFNAELGKKLAYEDAVRQAWPLFGFNLRQKLHDVEMSHQ
jgi:hypothetical protein